MLHDLVHSGMRFTKYERRDPKVFLQVPSKPVMGLSRGPAASNYTFDSHEKFGESEHDEKCTALLQRLRLLDNIEEISATGTDDLFPAAQSAIGRAEDACMDSGSNQITYCSEYNYWTSMSNITRQIYLKTVSASMTSKKMEECVKRQPFTQQDKAYVENTCNETVSIICDETDPTTGAKDVYLLGPLPPFFNGTGPAMFATCEYKPMSE